MEEITIIPLGTVSPFCYQEKSCPGFLIKYKEFNILLDCGNGSLRYLNIPEDLNNLTVIISHLHSDHYGDLLSLAQTSLVYNRLGYLPNKIKVYIPDSDKVKKNINYQDIDGWWSSKTIEANLIDFDYLLNLNNESHLKIIPYIEKNSLKFGDLEVTFKVNPHQLLTYSIKLATKDLKLVYSSDTGPLGNCLEKFADSADLLICESTFLRGQSRYGNNHLFAYEAAEIAKKANVKELLLTHFWPVNDKEEYVSEAKSVFANTNAAVEGKKRILRKN